MLRKRLTPWQEEDKKRKMEEQRIKSERLKNEFIRKWTSASPNEQAEILWDIKNSIDGKANSFHIHRPWRA